MKLSSKDALQLAKICGMLGSCFDGERSAAALKASEFLKDRGLTWYDLFAVSEETDTEWLTIVQNLLSVRGAMTMREQEFLTTMEGWRGTPTVKQSAWLHQLARKYRR